jgi:hypothetical protein
MGYHQGGADVFRNQMNFDLYQFPLQAGVKNFLESPVKRRFLLQPPKLISWIHCRSIRILCAI